MAKLWITFKSEKTIWYKLFKLFPYKWFGNLIENKTLLALTNEKTGKLFSKYSLKSMKWRQHWI